MNLEAQTKLASPSQPPALSLVMPCYNEASHIEETIRKWHQLLTEEVKDFEIIVLNDGSMDGCGRILDRIRTEMDHIRVIHQLRNRHGLTVRRGYELARGQYILQVDPNGCYDPSDFLPFWNARSENELIVGKRTHRLDSFFSRFFSKVVRRGAILFFKCPLEEPYLSFRLARKSALLPALKQLPPDWEWVNLALTLMTHKAFPGRVRELPLPFRFRVSATRRARGGWSLGKSLSAVWHIGILRLKITRSGRRFTTRQTQSIHS